MELEHIKVNGVYYRPQKAGVKDKHNKWVNYPVCTIKKLWFGFWQIDYYCEIIAWEKGYIQAGEENYPNKRIILSPLHIQEISYKL
jgi:hypothetical protein